MATPLDPRIPRTLLQAVTVVSVSLAATAVLPAVAVAQFPGGALGRTDIHTLQFRQITLGEVTSFMQSWERSWKEPDLLSPRDHYTRDAALLQPGGAFIVGRDSVRNFVRQFDGITAEARAVLLDFDASDGISYFYGPFSFVARDAAQGEVSGRKVTILVREGRDWRIRAQFFAAVDSSFRLAAGTMFPPPFEFSRPTSDEQSAYGFAMLLMQALRQQWSTGEGGGGRGLASSDLLLQLPGEPTPLQGAAAVRALESQRGILYTGIADFHHAGRISYVMGAYHLQRADQPGRAGRYMAVLMRYDGVWLLRSLIFT
jgi:ketosteroid isomerase-like protein